MMWLKINWLKATTVQQQQTDVVRHKQLSFCSLKAGTFQFFRQINDGDGGKKIIWRSQLMAHGS